MVLKLKSHFARYGCSDQVISDNGPQFDSEVFRTFSRTWEFKQLTNSLGKPRANGKAESAVKTAESLLRKALDSGKDPYMAILDYRKTPTQGMDSSPVQRLMNRRTRTQLPTTKSLLQPKVTYPERTTQQLERRKEQQARYYNRGSKDLPDLAEGDVLRMKPFIRVGDKAWKKATVTGRLDDKSYTVETSEGTIYRRNRNHLKKTAEKNGEGVGQEGADTPPQPSTTPQVNVETPPETSLKSSPEARDMKTPMAETPTPSPAIRPQRVRRPPAYLQDYVRK